MLKRFLSTAFMTLSTLIGIDGVATAATQIFNFSYQSVWYETSSGTPVITNTFLVGSFTGTLEPDGLIERADLTSFSAALTLQTTTTFRADLTDLTLFSYDWAGGATTLDFIAALPLPPNTPPPPPPFYICAGAATVLDEGCNPGGSNPFNARADLVIVTPITFTTDFPRITRVPEAPTWAMLMLGFAGLSLAGALARRSRSSSPRLMVKP